MKRVLAGFAGQCMQQTVGSKHELMTAPTPSPSLRQHGSSNLPVYRPSIAWMLTACGAHACPRATLGRNALGVARGLVPERLGYLRPDVGN